MCAGGREYLDTRMRTRRFRRRLRARHVIRISGAPRRLRRRRSLLGVTLIRRPNSVFAFTFNHSAAATVTAMRRSAADNRFLCSGRLVNSAPADPAGLVLLQNGHYLFSGWLVVPVGMRAGEHSFLDVGLQNAIVKYCGINLNYALTILPEQARATALYA